MSDVLWSLRLSSHKLDTEDGEEVGIRVAVIEGSPQPQDLLQAALAAAASVLARRVEEQQLDGEGICELLDEVWNTLADMIDGAVEQSSTKAH
jgi:hypothetical protein